MLQKNQAVLQPSPMLFYRSEPISECYHSNTTYSFLRVSAVAGSFWYLGSKNLLFAYRLFLLALTPVCRTGVEKVLVPVSAITDQDTALFCSKKLEHFLLLYLTRSHSPCFFWWQKINAIIAIPFWQETDSFGQHPE